MLDAAAHLLGTRPDASVEEIAEAAGVSRQTVYAHFGSRDGLLRAVLDRITLAAVAALDAARLDEGSAADALVRYLDAGWDTVTRYPVLGHLLPEAADGELERHEPALDRLARLVRRGQDSGEFDRALSPDWLLAATFALGHAAGAEVTAGRADPEQARIALRRSVLRVFGVGEEPGTR